MLGDQYWNEASFDPIKIQVTSRSYGLSQIVNVYIDENPDDPSAAVLGV